MYLIHTSGLRKVLCSDCCKSVYNKKLDKKCCKTTSTRMWPDWIKIRDVPQDLLGDVFCCFLTVIKCWKLFLKFPPVNCLLAFSPNHPGWGDIWPSTGWKTEQWELPFFCRHFWAFFTFTRSIFISLGIVVVTRQGRTKTWIIITKDDLGRAEPYLKVSLQEWTLWQR